jgi:protein-disulfide isomerase
MNKSAKTPTPKAGASRWLLPAGILAAAITAGVVLGGLTSETGKDAAAAPAAAPQVAAKPAPQANPIPRVKLDLEGAPVFGPKDAPVTLVEFTDYQCPFCRRAHATLNQVKAKYGDKIRLVYMQNPLAFHGDAPLAAKAALAAGEQGRFREMHDLLLSGADLKQNTLLAHARSLSLDVAAFTAAMTSSKFDTRIQQDQAQASRVGASATPFFFINGRTVRGAQPMASFEAIIDQELAGNLPPTKWVASAVAPPSQRPAEDPNHVYKVDMANSISRGPKDAPITLVEITAFQCGFCRRSQATIQEIMDTYPGKVRHVVMYKPLRAPTAAIASLAADRQDKYWEYRNLLFANQQAMTEPNLLSYAQQLGMDVERFTKDRQDPALTQFIENNSRQASTLGVTGTPTFFINGKKLVGAQPFAAFQQIIEQELKTPVQAAAAS